MVEEVEVAGAKGICGGKGVTNIGQDIPVKLTGPMWRTIHTVHRIKPEGA